VADAICAILGRRYEGYNDDIVRQGFIDLEDIFWGPSARAAAVRHALSRLAPLDEYGAVHDAPG